MGLNEDVLAKIAPGALGMVAEITANIQPENEVAEFIDKNIGILSKSKVDEGSDVAFGLLQKLSVAEANKDPAFSLQKLLEFYEQFRVWYVDYTATIPWTIPHPDEIDAENITDDTYVPPLNIDLTKDDKEYQFYDGQSGKNIESKKDDATDPE